MNRIALIGPTGVGKTTTAKLVAAHYGIAHIALDETRHAYLEETDYDSDHANELKRRDFEAVVAYWENYNLHVVRRTLESHPFGVFDFGAIHSVYSGNEKLKVVKDLLVDFNDVVFLLPSADKHESLEFLIERGHEPGMSEKYQAMWRRIINRFISDGSNYHLCTRLIFTEGKTPAGICTEIISTK